MDGRLTKALRLKGIKEFKAKDYGLKPVAVTTFGPLVFINLNPNANHREFKDDYKEVYKRLEMRQFNVRESNSVMKIMNISGSIMDKTS